MFNVLALFLLFVVAAPSLRAEPPGIAQSSELLTVPEGDKFLRWYGHEDRSYFLQISDANNPLTQWLWAPIIESGNDEEISYEVDGTAAKGFFRLKYADQIPGPGESLETADFDHDGISNLDEIVPPPPLLASDATDPLNPDTDGDSLLDGWERIHGLNPNDNGSTNPDNGPNGDPDHDGSTNAQEQAAGSSPTNQSSTPGDRDGDGQSNEQDAAPGEIMIDWPRSPEGSYVVIDLKMEPLEPLPGPHGRHPVPAILNDHNEVCREPYPMDGETTPATWDGQTFPITWTELPDFTNANDDAETFEDLAFSFNNSQQTYHGLRLDDGSDDSPGERAITIEWGGSNSAAGKYGDYATKHTHRAVHSRFDRRAEEEFIYAPGPSGSVTSTVIAPGFTVTATAAESTNLPRIEAFNLYSSAPDITRTGKILVSQNGTLKISGITPPDNTVYGIAADPFDNTLVTIPGGGVRRHRNGNWETMPMPGIMDMNASGTGITFPDHQLWRNGNSVDLNVLLSGSGWEDFKVEQINESGTLLGSAKKIGGNGDFLPVLFLRVEVKSNSAKNNGEYNLSKHNPAYYPRPGNTSINSIPESLENALRLHFEDCTDPDEIEPRSSTHFDLIAGTGDPIKLGNLKWTVVEKPPGSPELTPNQPDHLIRLMTNNGQNLRGGLYRFKLEGVDGSVGPEPQVWLPLAGPDITAYWQSEITYFKGTWGPAYRAKLATMTEEWADSPNVRELFKQKKALEDMQEVGRALDWHGSPKGQYSPCGGPNSGSGGERRLTIAKVVVDFRKRNNMMYALIGREMGIPEDILVKAADPTNNPFATGAPDNEQTKQSYLAGVMLFYGVSLESTMRTVGRKMQNLNSWSRYEWPSWETTDEPLIRAMAAQLDALIQ